jgi:arylsulfatase
VTLGEVLGAAGYRTALAGKWHLAGRSIAPEDAGSPREGNYPLANQRGFQHWFGTVGGSGSYWYPHDLVRDGVPIAPEGDDFYYTDAISDYAAQFVRDLSAGDAPFFLYVAYTAPHWPLHAPEAEIARFRGAYHAGWDALRAERHERQRDAGIVERSWPIAPRDELAPPWEETQDHAWEDARMATYAAQVAMMDAGIGRILAAVEERGIAEDTLVLFMSDNGACEELLREDGLLDAPLAHTRDGHPVRSGNRRDTLPGPADTFMSYDLPWANLSTTPFRLFKHWTHEGGISTPFIAWWPGQIAMEGIRHEPCHFVDVMPTLCALAGATYPTEFDGRAILPCEGESFAPLLAGRPWERERPLCFEHEGNLAVRQGVLKLVRMYGRPWELYEMARDRTESDDLAARYPETTRWMVSLYEDWAARIGVPAWETVYHCELERTRAYEARLGGRRIWDAARPAW